jgi:hypothetical protein
MSPADRAASSGADGIADWIASAQQWLADAAQGEHGGLATGSAECGLCPVCRLIAALRAADPAVVTTVVEAAAGAAIAAVDVLREAGESLLADRDGERDASSDADAAGGADASDGEPS